MTEIMERRTRLRRDLTYYLRGLDASNGHLIGYVANITPRGVMLICEDPIAPGSMLELAIVFPAKINGKNRLEFVAKSRWCKLALDTDLYAVGCEVARIDPDDLRLAQSIYSSPRLHIRSSLTFKRLFDLVMASAGLLLVFPLLLLIGLLIAFESKGPILYAANRVGMFGQLFRMYKFRTMAKTEGNRGPRITARDDPRITHWGRFLRRTKLNELPQLFNVLKGDMSFVGPRPEDEEFVAHYSPEQRAVLSVKPGITSLATILYVDEELMLRFSDATETYLRSVLPDKLRLDLLYIQNRSMLLDIDILFQTMLVLIPRFRKAAPHVEDILMGPVRMAGRYMSWFAIDAAIALLSVSLAGVLWRLANPIDVGVGGSLIAALLITALFSLTNRLIGVQRIQWRYASLSEAIGVVGSAVAATVILLITNSLIQPPLFPPQMLIMAGIFALSGFLASRYRRSIRKGLASRIENLRSIDGAGRERVLIVGAGGAAQLTILMLRNKPAGRAFHIVGAVDDDLNLLGTSLHSVPVLGVCDRIHEIVRQKDVGTIVFSIHSIEDTRRRYLLRQCQKTSARTVVVPDLLSSLSQSVAKGEDDLIRPIKIVDGSHAATSVEGTYMRLRSKIQMLAEQARKGDTASVARELGELETLLDAQQSIESAVPPERLQHTPTAGDQLSP